MPASCYAAHWLASDEAHTRRGKAASGAVGKGTIVLNLYLLERQAITQQRVTADRDQARPGMVRLRLGEDATLRNAIASVARCDAPSAARRGALWMLQLVSGGRISSVRL